MLRPNCWDEVGTENAILAERSIEIAPSTARSPAIPTDGVGGAEGSHNRHAPYNRHNRDTPTHQSLWGWISTRVVIIRAVRVR